MRTTGRQRAAGVAAGRQPGSQSLHVGRLVKRVLKAEKLLRLGQEARWWESGFGVGRNLTGWGHGRRRPSVRRKGEPPGSTPKRGLTQQPVIAAAAGSPPPGACHAAAPPAA